MGVVLFQIIQIIDSWISMSVLKKLLGDLGNLHFGKDADGYRIELEMNTGQLILLPRVPKIRRGGGVFVASWVVQRCWGKLPNIHYGLLRNSGNQVNQMVG